MGAADWLFGVYLNADYCVALHSEGLNFEHVELVDVVTEGNRVRSRRIVARPRSNAPKVVQKVLGTTQEYEQPGHLVSDLEWRYRVVPATLSNKITIDGVLRVVPLGPARCRAEFEATFDVSIFGVGAAVERFLVSQFDENMSKQAAFAQRWVIDRHA